MGTPAPCSSAAVEIALLFALSWLPAAFSDRWIVLTLAFALAMLVSAFPSVDVFTYSATFTTGNIRQFAEAAFQIAFTPVPGDSLLRRKPQVFAIVIVSFLAGAALGAASVVRWHNRSLWFPIALLILAGSFCSSVSKESVRT